ncbi:MAG TPA: hypothetical protein VGY14_00390 [Methyloceanibacter sp.]|jgi:hypothetical protein|nr:hypothetical protein [Methyloceanibacter sp.]
MTNDPKKFFEIARVCATLSKSAATTPEERDTFADLANRWQRFATDAEACLKPLDECSDPDETLSA